MGTNWGEHGAKKEKGDALKAYYRRHRNRGFITDVKTNFTGKIEGSYREPGSLPRLVAPCVPHGVQVLISCVPYA